MTTTLRPDICVIGAGSGGLTVAAAAASFGVDVVLIEKGKMGGDCLNYGCVPSKAIIAAGKHAHAIAEAPHFGVNAGEVKIDYKKVHEHIHSVIGAIAPNDSVERFTALGVKVIEAAAAFTDPDTVVAGDYEIKARRYVVATGSTPFVPPIPGLDTVDYLTNETLFDRTQRARHLIVIGGGPIGMEMAQAHRRLGSEVTVIEGLKALGKDDPELAAVVLDRIRAEGVTIMEGTSVTAVKKFGRAGVRVTVESEDGESTVDGSHILVATGRAVNVEGIGLTEAGIEYDRKGIKVQPNLKTTNRRVFAIGDVAGGLQFTHVAGYHAGLVVQQILFRAPAKQNTGIIPWATYTDPELAHVGLGEEEARKKHGEIQVLRWPYAENDRALAERKTDGLIKLITDKKGRVVGVSIAGAGAGEMINMWALAIANKMRLSNVRGYVPPYPTMAEIGKRAAITYYSPMTRKPFVRRIIGFMRRFG
ncbi:dihydrolipoyl dehydrogenase family protein [Hoeflea poritis]|uniref:FAD-dependent oxidoreductase n=1 Tax=Hoeflea poritis TaxID=2993659 RepID=A0ABT4VNH0_9HYPH|nr:FAD-dependent oxidoreductase [Hoeflea poritis]MDA4846253.1 FAD-dependent oxidoreductase [Hoeflea poritis]